MTTTGEMCCVSCTDNIDENQKTSGFHGHIFTLVVAIVYAIMPVFPLLDLPQEVLANIFGSFLDGKSISTFLHVASCCQTHQQQSNNIDDLIRAALVQRYAQLRRQLEEKEEQQVATGGIQETLMVLGEDIRTSTTTNKFPEWCAILDYFESQQIMNSTTDSSGLIVWCGPVETTFGIIQAYLTCRDVLEWNIGSLHYWYYEEELLNLALVHPLHDLENVLISNNFSNYYGDLKGLGDLDTFVVQQLHGMLDDQLSSSRHYLIARHNLYNNYDDDEEDGPPEFFVPNGEEPTSLACYWAHEEYFYDWEAALDQLGDNVIRIMTRSIERKGCFP